MAPGRPGRAAGRRRRPAGTGSSDGSGATLVSKAFHGRRLRMVCAARSSAAGSAATAYGSVAVGLERCRRTRRRAGRGDRRRRGATVRRRAPRSASGAATGWSGWRAGGRYVDGGRDAAARGRRTRATTRPCRRANRPTTNRPSTSVGARSRRSRRRRRAFSSSICSGGHAEAVVDDREADAVRCGLGRDQDAGARRREERGVLHQLGHQQDQVVDDGRGHPARRSARRCRPGCSSRSRPAPSRTTSSTASGATCSSTPVAPESTTRLLALRRRRLEMWSSR